MSSITPHIHSIDLYDGATSQDAACHVDLWWVDLDDVGASKIPRWLPSCDRERIERMGTPLLQQRMAVTRIALRTILSHYANLAPDALPILANAHGWPYLDASEIGKPIWFNLSHAQDRMLLAVSHQARLGADLEKLDRKVDPDKLAKAVFNDEDCRWMNAQPHRPRAFLNLWTAKEAVLKLCGTGFQIPAPLVNVNWNTMTGSIDGTSQYHPNLNCRLRTTAQNDAENDVWSAHLALATTEGTSIEIHTRGELGDWRQLS